MHPDGPEGPKRDLRNRTVAGAGWTAAGQVLRHLVLLATQVVLIRLLSPREFGLMAMALPFTALAFIFGNMGLAAGIIQRPKVRESEVSTAFWLSLAGGAVAAVAAVVLAGPVAAFYGEPEVRRLLSVLAVTIPIAAVNGVQRARLERDLVFRPLVMIDAVATAVAGAVGVVAATLGAGAWSLVLLAVAQQIVTGLGLLVVEPWRPSWSAQRAEAIELLRLGGGLIGFEVVNMASRNIDDLLIGKVLGPVQLGTYSRAYEVMLQPVRQVGAVLGRVMFASLARMGDDPARVKHAYLRAISVVALFTFPAMIGVFVLADEFVRSVFGEQWTDSIPVVRILSVAGLAQSVITTTGWIYLSQGRTGLMFRWGVGAGLALVAGIVGGIWFGTIEAVAIGYAIATGPVLLYPAFTIPGRLIGMSFADVARALLPTLGVAAAMGVVVAVMAQMNPLPTDNVAGLTALAALGTALHFGLAHLFRLGGYIDLLDVLDERLAARRTDEQ